MQKQVSWQTKSVHSCFHQASQLAHAAPGLQCPSLVCSSHAMALGSRARLLPAPLRAMKLMTMVHCVASVLLPVGLNHVYPADVQVPLAQPRKSPPVFVLGGEDDRVLDVQAYYELAR